MAPYLVLAAAVAVFGYLICERHPSKRNDLIFLSVVSIVLIAMSTIRASSVGVDYEPYLAYFKQVYEGGLGFVFSGANQYRIEIGYSLLNYVISLFGGTQIVFALGIAVVCIGLTAVFLYRYSPSVWVSMFVFISFGFFGYTLCTIRHQIAICIFMFALPHLQNKKFFPYLLIVLLSATFHKSMLVLILVYFLAQLPLNKVTLGVYCGGTLLFVMFSEPIMTFITKYIYQSYQVDSYYMQGRDFQTGLIPIVLFLVVFLLKKQLLARNPRNLPLINLCFYSALLFFMTYKHFVFQRFALILLPVAMLLLPEIMRCMAISEEDRLELELAQKAVKSSAGDKKRALQKYGEVKARLHDRQAMYHATIGFILFGGFTYFLFLLVANRLLLVPYVTI
ncbi:EpsG family protein [Hydrogenoanaerobacterium sp.]|uniref:EpsG family protein n=1 Tax=Hydrogenoanaerobacterium sp. TaxID=2953763 RepID=UPI00289D63A8|nr:EpsG family protein [Hydrogenoanaerobacterium sp.]